MNIISSLSTTLICDLKRYIENTAHFNNVLSFCHLIFVILKNCLFLQGTEITFFEIDYL